MRDRTKIWLSIATFCVGAGLILFVIVMTLKSWDFSNLSTIELKTETHTIDEAFQNIELNTESADILFELSRDGKCSVECSVPEDWEHSVDVTESTLRISLKDTTRWYERIGINIRSPKITVYLPEKFYNLLTADTDSGDIHVPNDLTFVGIDIKTGSGDVECDALTTGTVRIVTSSGNVSLSDVTAETIDVSSSSGDVTANNTHSDSFFVSTSSGNQKLRNIYCTGDLITDVTSGDAQYTDVTCRCLMSKGGSGELSVNSAMVLGMLNIERQSGDVTLKKIFVEAVAYITTTSGDVTGSLTGDVSINANSKSGDINAPWRHDTDSATRYDINTDSGDIKITDYEVPAAPVTQAVERSNNITLIDNPESNSQYLPLNSFVLYRNKEKYSDAHLVVAVKRNIPVSEIPSDRIIGGLGFDSDDLHEDFTVRRKDYPLLDEDISIVFDFDDIFATADSLGAKKLQVIIDGNAGFSLTGIYLVYEE